MGTLGTRVCDGGSGVGCRGVSLVQGWACLGPYGRITPHEGRSGPHPRVAIVIRHDYKRARRDFSLAKHIRVTRSLLKAMMADAQPFARSALLVSARGAKLDSRRE